MANTEQRISRAAVRDALSLCAVHFKRPDVVRFHSAAMSWLHIGIQWDCRSRPWASGGPIVQRRTEVPRFAAPMDRGSAYRLIERTRRPHPYDLAGRDGLREVHRTFGCGMRALQADLKRAFL